MDLVARIRALAPGQLSCHSNGAPGSLQPFETEAIEFAERGCLHGTQRPRQAQRFPPRRGSGGGAEESVEPAPEVIREPGGHLALDVAGHLQDWLGCEVERGGRRFLLADRDPAGRRRVDGVLAGWLGVIDGRAARSRGPADSGAALTRCRSIRPAPGSRGASWLCTPRDSGPSRSPPRGSSGGPARSTVDADERAGLHCPLTYPVGVKLPWRRRRPGPDEIARLVRLAVEHQARSSELFDRYQWEEALTAAREAVSAWRQVRRLDRSHGVEFATALFELSVRLFYTDRYEEAVECARESVERFWRLSRRDRQHRPALARAEINLGSWLWAAGRHSEAIRVTRLAEGIWRILAREDPRHRLGLAQAVFTIGDKEMAAGRYRDAKLTL